MRDFYFYLLNKLNYKFNNIYPNLLSLDWIVFNKTQLLLSPEIEWIGDSLDSLGLVFNIILVVVRLFIGLEFDSITLEKLISSKVLVIYEINCKHIINLLFSLTKYLFASLISIKSNHNVSLIVTELHFGDESWSWILEVFITLKALPFALIALLYLFLTLSFRTR
jgi:hypothetical protein